MSDRRARRAPSPPAAPAARDATPGGRRRKAAGLAILFFVALLALIPFLVPIPDAWEQRRLLRTLGSQYHVVIPLVLTLLVMRWRPLARRIWLAAGLVALLFWGVELVQAATGRHARWQDFLLDVAGIGLALSWLWWRRRRASPALAAGGVILAALLVNVGDMPAWVLAERQAAARFPLLADFETRRERAAWGPNDDGHYAIRRRPDGQGRCLCIFSEGPRKYPGAILAGFPADWRGRSVLEWRARAECDGVDAPLRLGVRLDDLGGRRDRAFAYRVDRVGPRWTTYRLELSDLPTTRNRPLALDAVVSLLFYVPQPQPAGRVLIDDVRLR